MKIDQMTLNWLKEIIEEGKVTAEGEEFQHEGWDEYTEHFTYTEVGINGTSAKRFEVRALSCISQIFDESSLYYKQLSHETKSLLNKWSFLRAIAILEVALNNIESGYLTEAKILIEAEVFDDFLEQAEQLFAKGYHAPAAVVAGCVLEDGLKKLCAKNEIVLDAKATMNPANDALAKQGVYNTLMQKKILALADLRNKAAHGQWTEFSKEDVGDMIKSVRSFLETHYV